MSEQMQQVTFDGSLKNIPHASRKEYFMKMFHEASRFNKDIEWGVAMIDVDDEDRKERWGFPTQSKAKGPFPLLDSFKEKFANLIKNIEFKPNSNEFQKKIRKDISRIDKNKNILVAADKTTNFYAMKPKDFEKLARDSITTQYKRSTMEAFNQVNKEDRVIANDLDIANRVFITTPRESVILLKDHKENFRNNPQTRIINPNKQELGKVSKQVVEKLVEHIKKVTDLKQFLNTGSALQWFVNIEDKQKRHFITGDIRNFYGEISEELLNKALDWAETFKEIDPQHREIILQVRKTFLFHKGKPWVKKEGVWDISQGSYDSAEVTDLVGLYLLQQIRDKDLGVDPCLYRDDFVTDSDKDTNENEDIKKAICEVFTDNGLHLKAQANQKVIDFLDVTLNLNTGEYSPYNKPNNIPVYVNAGSNHPPKVLQNIALGVQKRLSTNSSSEEVFNKAKPMYQDALNKAGHKHQLKYEPVDVNSLNKKRKKRKRYKRLFWFTPPYEMTVASSLGKDFINLVKEEFPPGHPYHSVLNEHTIRFSYSVNPNLKKKITYHNIKVSQQEDIKNQNKTNVPNRTIPVAAPEDNGYDPNEQVDYEVIEVISTEPEPVNARACNDCDVECGGLIVETVPAPPPPPPPPPHSGI